jgi:centrosomal CEP192-like protein/type IX secretion system substrate protein
LVFHPRVPGQREGRITFTSNGPTSPDTLHVDGNGVGPSIAISPSGLSFGAVSLALSQLDSVLVRNPSGATLSINSIVSNNASQFGIINAGPVSVLPGDSLRIRVTFHPTTLGQKDGRITFTHNGASSPDTIHVNGVGVRLTALVPRYLEGDSATGANRIPFAYRAHLEGLLASHAYRYINQVVTSTDPASSNGAGNCIFASPSGAFVRSTTPDLGTTGNYGTLTTDSSGVYDGWFVTESNGNPRFAPAGFVFMRICINDGGAGTTVFGRITTTDSVRVVKLGPASDASSGTGLRGASGGTARQFVFVYDDSTGTGRPVSGSFVESDGTVNTTGNGYASFYADFVDTVGGAFGVVVPNLLPNGIRLVVQRSLVSGAVIAYATDVDGTWPSGASTVNPAGGTTAIVLTQGDLNHTTDVEPGPGVVRRFMLSQNGPNPFRPTTTIRFSVAEGGVATVVVYDVLGKVVATPFSGLVTPGQVYTVTVDGKRLQSGVYWYRLKSGNRTATKKMVLLR